MQPVNNPGFSTFINQQGGDPRKNQGYNEKGNGYNSLLSMVRAAETMKMPALQVQSAQPPVAQPLTINPILQSNFNPDLPKPEIPKQQHNLAALLNGSNVTTTEIAREVSKSVPQAVSMPLVSPQINMVQMKSEDIKALMAAKTTIHPSTNPPKDKEEENDVITAGGINNKNIIGKSNQVSNEDDDEDEHGKKVVKPKGRLLGHGPKNNNIDNPKNNPVRNTYPVLEHLEILNGPNLPPPEKFSNDAMIQKISQYENDLAAKRELQQANQNALISLLPGNKSYLKEVDLSGLSDGQRNAIEAIFMGKNILLTGPAGTGKSHCIQKIRDIFVQKKMNVAMTSTTGASAILIDGNTVHSWSGIGICGSKETALKRVLEYKKPQERLKTTHLLIIDEVSMLSGLVLEILDYVARMVRQNDAPFGGIQVLLCGDFYQLSPVKAPTYAFESPAFKNLIHEVHELTQIFRQDDEDFCIALNEIRIGEVSEKTKRLFEQCIGRKFEGDIKPTQLYPVKVDVDFENQEELWKLASETNMVREIAALDEVVEKPQPRKPHPQKFYDECKARLNKDCIAPELLQLCIGAQVMLIKNLEVEMGLANGSRAVVVGFDGAGAPICRFRNGQVIYMYTQSWWMRVNETARIRRTQYPLILAFAITIHKSQGQTLDCLETDLGERIFDNHQTYTAISRTRRLTDLSIKQIDWDKVTVDKRVKEFYRQHKK